MHIEVRNCVIPSEEHTAAQKLNLRPKRIFRWLLLLIAALLVLSMLFDILTARPGEPASLAWTGAFLIAYVLLSFLYLPYRWRRSYRQNKSLQRPFDLELLDDGFHAHNAEGDTITPWEDFHTWKENRTLFLIYRADNLFHLIPKRILGGEQNITELRETLQRGIGPERA